jgi:hypothetical protein
MNNFKRVSAAVLAGMVLWPSGASWALGFGQPSSRATLGDTLRVTIPLRLEAGEEVSNECMAADVYFGEEKVKPIAVRAEVLPGGSSERVLRVTTTALINEPIVTVYLAAGCKARITRKIVALADPPGMPTAGGAEAMAASELSDSPVTAVSPSLADMAGATSGQGASVHHGASSVAAATPKRAARVKTPAPSVVAQSVLAVPDLQLAESPVSESKATRRKSARAGRAATPPVARDEGARLTLDPVEADAMLSPVLRMTPALGMTVRGDDASEAQLQQRAAAAALWRAMNATPEQMARDGQRLRELEQRLAQLRHEAELNQKTLTTLHAQAQAAERSPSGRWLYLAVAVALAALGLSAFLFHRLRQVQHSRDGWWQSSTDGQEPSGLEAGASSDFDRTSVEFVHVPGRDGGGRVSTSAPAAPVSAPGAAMASEPVRPLAASSIHHLVPDTAPASLQIAALSSVSVEPLREVSVEELIDLEQQAEFFIVLGQDEAAIDLLEGHVQNTTGASPLPFLKLLELYRRIGRRGDYERVQAAFNQRFNAYAPSWDVDLSQGHSLSDYPGVIDRLQALWGAPTKAMAVLEKSLTRPDSGDDTFDLPAYRELLFLYAVARDLAERGLGEPEGSIDLLLPEVDLGDAPSQAVVDDAPRVIEPLMATRPIKAQPEARPSLSLDLELEDIEPPRPDHKP